VVGSDVVDGTRLDRQVRGSFTVSVFGVPDAPSPPQPGLVLRSGSAVVSFVPGADNGSPVMEYQLQWVGGNRSCGLNTTCEVPGLVNGTAYRFQVRAVNKAGPSVWSELGPEVVPNALPGRVTGFGVAARGCGSVTLKWTGVDGDGSAATAYYLSWTGQGEPVELPGSATGYEAKGLANGSAYTFTIVARNEAGPGPSSVPLDVVPACQPEWPDGTQVLARDESIGSTPAVTVSWPPVDARGPKPVTYEVTRTNAQGVQTLVQTTQELAAVDTKVVYDGTEYKYTVIARNGAPGTEPSEPREATWTARAAPAAWGTGAVSAGATGINGEIHVKVDQFPDFRDAPANSTVTVTLGQQQITLQPARGGEPAHDEGTFTNLPNGEQVEVSFTACNSVGCNQPQRLTRPGPFGPLMDPGLTARQGTKRNVCFDATGDGNGRPARLVITAPDLTGKTVEVYRSPEASSGKLSADACIDAGAWDRKVTFTARLATEQTDPPRGDSPGPNSPEVTYWATSAKGAPDDWADGDVTVTPNTDRGTLIVSVKKLPAANAGTVTVYMTWSVDEKTESPEMVLQPGRDYEITGPNPSGGSEGLVPGNPIVVTVWAENEQGKNYPAVISAAPYLNLGAPQMIEVVQTSGTQACVKARTPDERTGGMEARLVVKVKDETIYSSPLDRGILETTQCLDTGGPGRSVTFVAQLVPGPGQLRGASPETIVVATSPSGGGPGPSGPTYGPMVLSVGVGSQPGGPVSENKEVCGVFNVDANGAPVQLEIRNDQNGEVLREEITGKETRQQCAQPAGVSGPGIPVTFTAKLTDRYNLGRGEQTQSVTVNTPLDADQALVLADSFPEPNTRGTDKHVCAFYDVSVPGSQVTLTMTATGVAAGSTFELPDYPGPVSNTGSVFQLDHCYETGGPGVSVKITATLTDAGGRVLTKQELTLVSAS